MYSERRLHASDGADPMRWFSLLGSVSLTGSDKENLFRFLWCPVCLAATCALSIAACSAWLTPPWESLPPFVQFRFGLLIVVFIDHMRLGLCALADSTRRGFQALPDSDWHPWDHLTVFAWRRRHPLATFAACSRHRPYVRSCASLLGLVLFWPERHVSAPIGLTLHVCIHTPIQLYTTWPLACLMLLPSLALRCMRTCIPRHADWDLATRLAGAARMRCYLRTKPGLPQLPLLDLARAFFPSVGPLCPYVRTTHTPVCMAGVNLVPLAPAHSWPETAS
ncbi:hypothetical protein V6N13_109489 [Hibiscus sabdariffa]